MTAPVGEAAETRRSIASRAYEQRRLRMIAAEVAGSRVLDIGYGRQPSPYLASDELVGLDLASVAPEDAPNYTERIVGDATDLSSVLGARRFDSVICGELIEHIEEPYAFLRQLHSVVDEGGNLIISTPNPLGFPVVLFEAARSTRFFYSPDHLYLFTPRWMKRMLSRTGFQLKAMRPVGLWLPIGCLPWSPVWLSYIVIYVATPSTAREG